MEPDTVIGVETGELSGERFVARKCGDSTSGLYVTNIDNDLITKLLGTIAYPKSSTPSLSLGCCLDSLTKGNQFRFLNDPLWSCQDYGVSANVRSFLGIDRKNAVLFVVYYTLKKVKECEQLYTNWGVSTWQSLCELFLFNQSETSFWYWQ